MLDAGTRPAPLVLDSGFFRDPEPVYAQLRAAGGAREAVLPGGLKVWVIGRYDDGRAALVDPRLSKRLTAAGALFDRHTQGSAAQRVSGSSVVAHMLNTDPPEHTRLRRLLGRAFTAHPVAAMRPRVVRIADRLLDAMAERGDVVDLIDAYAFPLPTAVLGELLGVPATDRPTFDSWSHTLVDVTGTGNRDQLEADALAMAGYLAELIADRRAHPGDDLLSGLVAAAGADRCTDLELVSMAFLVLVAGHDTTVNLVGNGVLALLCQPEQHRALVTDPELIPGAVEELLRFAGPVNFSTLRYTTVPVEVGDTTIPAGEFVVVALNSTGRDARRFAEPDRLDVRRAAAGHLAFGHGAHYCIGAPLARLEGEVAFRRLLSRFPDLRLAADPEDLVWWPSSLLHSMEKLPVRLRAEHGGRGKSSVRAPDEPHPAADPAR